MRILSFFVNIIDPGKVRKYKGMSIFFALLIFFCTFWLLLLPSKNYIKKHSYETAGIYDYTVALYNIKDTNPVVFENMKAKGYKIENGKITSNGFDEEVNVYTYLYSFDEKNMCVYFIFDPTDKLDEKIEEVENRIEQVYPDNNKEQAFIDGVAHLAYLESLDELVNLDDSIKKYYNMDANELAELVQRVPFYEYYNVRGMISNSNFAYTFTKDSVIRSIDGENDVYSYSYLDFDISKYEKLEDFGKDLGIQMVEQYNEYLFNIQILWIFIYTIILPVIVALIVCLFTRKFKKLTSIFEYYKILSLVTIIPTIVSCIFIFMFGPGARKVFVALFIIYSALMLYRASTVEEKYEQKEELTKL